MSRATCDNPDHPKQGHVHQEPGGDPACSNHGMMTADDKGQWSCLNTRCKVTADEW